MRLDQPLEIEQVLRSLCDRLHDQVRWHEREGDMARKNLKVGRYQDIERRLAEGRSGREIANALGRARRGRLRGRSAGSILRVQGRRGETGRVDAERSPMVRRVRHVSAVG